MLTLTLSIILQESALVESCKQARRERWAIEQQEFQIIMEARRDRQRRKLWELLRITNKEREIEV
jgi:hypothetical protein